MHLRPATADDLDALLAFPLDPHLDGVEPGRLQEEFHAGRMRWPWTWLALDDNGTVVGRALWWGRPESTAPLTLDCLHLLDHVADRPAIAADLLRAAHRSFTTTPDADASTARPPEYHLILPPHWRDEPATAAALSWRVRAAAQAGLSEQLERLRYEWTPNDPAPVPSGQLLFRPGDDQEFLGLFQRSAVDTLDVTTRRSLAVMDPATQARDDYDFYLSCPGERDWWRIATTPAGEPVGFVVPSATPYGRNVGYLGVLPAYRGHGLVDDLLSEVTRFHAEAGAQSVTATTDVTNTPMVGAFHRAGYRVTETRLVLEAPARSI